MTTGYIDSNNTGIGGSFEFYSGSQATVWFGNIMLDDVASIQWVNSQNKMPIYGYASQLFDAVAKGTVLVQGTFTVNFRQRGYIPAVMEAIKGLYNTLSPTDPNKKAQFSKTTWPAMQAILSEHLSRKTFGPKTIQEIQDIGNNPNFEQVAAAYSNIVWGNNYGQDSGINDTSPADIKQSNEIPQGFDILISYGNPAHSEVQSIPELMRSTTKKINNVHLLGESQVVMVGGRPVQEQYSFLARSVDDYDGALGPKQ